MKKYLRSQESKKAKSVFNEFLNHLGGESLPASALEDFYRQNYGGINLYYDYKTDCDCDYCLFVRNQIIDTDKYVNNINKKSGICLSEIFIRNFFK
ncbi:MAG: hypothetical protein ACOYL8_04910 [Patescibacteria group bacterium]